MSTTARPAGAPPPTPGGRPPAPGAPSPAQQQQRVISPRALIPAAIPLETISGVIKGAESIVAYGPEGVGKSTAAAYLPRPYSMDVESSTNKLNISRDRNIPTWPILRGKLATFASSPPPGVETLIIDTGTAAQLLAKEFVVATRKAGTGKRDSPLRDVSSIEEFGWGQGWQYVAEEFDGMIADLDRALARGIHVCVLCHSAGTEVEDPSVQNYRCFEPALYAGDKNKKGSIRDRLIGWAEHVVFINYDVFVDEAGKAKGSGTRSIYTQALPSHRAKSRTAQVIMPYELTDPGAIWRELGILPAAR